MVKFDDEIKGRLIQLREDGLGNKRIAKELGVSNSTVHRWLNLIGMGGQLEEYKPIDIEATSTTKRCKECGERFKAVNSYAEFCGDRCRSSHNRKHRGKQLICKNCGESFNSYKDKTFCSVECFRKDVEENKETKTRYVPVKRIEKNCKECGVLFETTASVDRDYCSGYCKKKHNLPRHNRRCAECGGWFNTTKPKAKYCSSTCRRRRTDRQRETARRIRIASNGPVHWDISIERLIKRDGKKCYLCGGNVKLNVDPNHDDYPSIEHVEPLSKGGTHTWDNVKIAHRRCNYLKSDK